ncbi:MAG: phosphopantetheine-binding protein [Bacteroidota bacterium]
MIDELKAIIQAYLPDDISTEDISSDSHLINDLRINSANLVDIVIDVEDKFDIEISNEEIENMSTVGDAISIIERKAKT